MSQTKEIASRIRQTLLEDQKPVWDREISILAQELNQLLVSADKMFYALEKNQRIWSDYITSLNKVKAILENTKLPEERPATLAAIRSGLQNITRYLTEVRKNQEIFNDLNNKARNVDRLANDTCRNFVSRQVAGINKQWQEVYALLESQLAALTEILNQWEIYTQVMTKVQSWLSELEHKSVAIQASNDTNENDIKVSV